MVRHLWWVLGFVLMVGGVIVALVSRAGPSDFGWFAYAPLSDDPQPHPSSSGLVMLSTWQLCGAALAAVGVLILGMGAGFRLGRRGAVRR